MQLAIRLKVVVDHSNITYIVSSYVWNRITIYRWFMVFLVASSVLKWLRSI